MTGAQLCIRPVGADDTDYVINLVTEHFGSTQVVSRGRLHDCETLKGFLAMAGTRRVGLVQIAIRDGELEVVTLVSELDGAGVGRGLLERVVAEARHLGGLSRCWLSTTNNNHNAINFYRHIGWVQCATHLGAVDEARKLKPEIPLTDDRGIEIRDELEFEWKL
ncbi:MAG: GNAT family N-acetyltransferase [Pseudomonadales bacterium]|jgi:GNAT superfamily N-acetyltransferase|nr:GNAT family N-acetyltransferase [Pseudomonadales bacterium]